MSRGVPERPFLTVVAEPHIDQHPTIESAQGQSVKALCASVNAAKRAALEAQGPPDAPPPRGRLD